MTSPNWREQELQLLRVETLEGLHIRRLEFRRLMALGIVLSLANLGLAVAAVIRLTEPVNAPWHWLAGVCLVLNACGCYLLTIRAWHLWHIWRFERASARHVIELIDHALPERKVDHVPHA